MSLSLSISLLLLKPLYAALLRGPGHLFVQFPMFCIYFYIVFFVLGLMLGSPLFFQVLIYYIISLFD
jgi:hypothetical protein